MILDNALADGQPNACALMIVVHLEAPRLIRERLAGIRVIIVGNHTTPAYVEEAFRIGADGYVVKNCDFAAPERAYGTRTAGGNAMQRSANYLKAQVAAADPSQVDRETARSRQSVAYA